MEHYTEDPRAGNAYREEYLSGIEMLLDRKREEADLARSLYINPELLKTDPERFRADFYKLLGWPLGVTADTIPPVKRELAAEVGAVTIYRLKIEVMDNLWFYGMLFLPAGAEKLPLVILQHGGGGTPEYMSEFIDRPTNYNSMMRRILSRGAAVFAPQTLIWDASRFGRQHNRAGLETAFKQLGSSIAALEIYCIMRSVDFLSCTPEIDKSRIGMAGLSYGGFYTLFTAACDTRIKAAYSSCFFNDRYKYGWHDWTWFNAAHKFLDAEVGALVCPRPLYIEVGKTDELFTPDTAVREFERLTSFYRAFGAEDKLRLMVFNGPHEFDRADVGVDFLFRHI